MSKPAESKLAAKRSRGDPGNKKGQAKQAKLHNAEVDNAPENDQPVRAKGRISLKGKLRKLQTEEGDNDKEQAGTGRRAVAKSRVTITTVKQYNELKKENDYKNKLQDLTMNMPRDFKKKTSVSREHYDSGDVTGKAVITFTSMDDAVKYLSNQSNLDVNNDMTPLFELNVSNAKVGNTYVNPETMGHVLSIKALPITLKQIQDNGGGANLTTTKPRAIPKKISADKRGAPSRSMEPKSLDARNAARSVIRAHLKKAGVQALAINFSIATMSFSWSRTGTIDVTLVFYNRTSLRACAFALESHPALNPASRYTAITDGRTGATPWYTCDHRDSHTECRHDEQGNVPLCKAHSEPRIIIFARPKALGALAPNITRAQLGDYMTALSGYPFKVHYNSVAANKKVSSWVFIDELLPGAFDAHGPAVADMLNYGVDAHPDMDWDEVVVACDICGTMDEHSTAGHTLTRTEDRQRDHIMLDPHKRREAHTFCRYPVCTTPACKSHHHGYTCKWIGNGVERTQQIPPAFVETARRKAKEGSLSDEPEGGKKDDLGAHDINLGGHGCPKFHLVPANAKPDKRVTDQTSGYP